MKKEIEITYICEIEISSDDKLDDIVDRTKVYDKEGNMIDVSIINYTTEKCSDCDGYSDYFIDSEIMKYCPCCGRRLLK